MQRNDIRFGTRPTKHTVSISRLAGIEMVSVNAPVALDAFSVPNRFFDSIRASYYVTDNSKLSIGHVYTSGRHGLTLGAEHGFALGGGRMASLFAQESNLDAEILDRVDIGDGSRTPGYQHPYSKPIGQR
jgi:hypothetical protein